MTQITYTGILSGRPRFEMSDEDEMRLSGVLPRWLIDAMAPVSSGGTPIKGREVLFVRDGILQTKTRQFQPGDTITEDDLSGRHVQEYVPPERHSAID